MDVQGVTIAQMINFIHNTQPLYEKISDIVKNDPPHNPQEALNTHDTHSTQPIDSLEE